MSQLNDSYKRCIINEKFFDRFYDIFLASNPRFGPLFKDTNFDDQKKLLRTGISMMVMFDEGQAISKSALTRLGKSHGGNGMNIDQNLYKFWIDSLVATVKECDPKFTPEIGDKWRIAMTTGVQFMTSQGN